MRVGDRVDAASARLCPLRLTAQREGGSAGDLLLVELDGREWQTHRVSPALADNQPSTAVLPLTLHARSDEVMSWTGELPLGERTDGRGVGQSSLSFDRGA